MKQEDKSEIFLSVIESNKGILYKVANSFCKENEGRKDLIQEIFVQLWKSFDNYNDEYKRSTWIYRISLNTAISFYRKETRRSKISYPLTELHLNLSDSNDKEAIESNLGHLQQFISELKEIDKALMLLYLDEKSYKEISEIIGYTETNVATKISRIKTALTQYFSLFKNQ
jgi:RNA polymerase sigma factor (sigma-70 family)